MFWVYQVQVTIVPAVVPGVSIWWQLQLKQSTFLSLLLFLPMSPPATTALHFMLAFDDLTGGQSSLEIEEKKNIHCRHAIVLAQHTGEITG